MKSSLTHQLGDAYRKAVSLFGGVETKSQFESKGTLTVQEFLEAGDALVFKFPTWQWAAASNKQQSTQKDYLPADKQFLVTRHVPCPKRVADLDANLSLSVVSMDKDADPWTSIGCVETQETGQAPRLEVVDEYLPSGSATLTELDRQLIGEDKDAALVVRQSEEEMRSYDLSITWDKFYQTPRLWLRGFKGDGAPLGEREVKEDVLADYASKTVTMEIHPATGELTASIHPCKHAEMMKRVIDTWKSHNITPRPDLSLFVFLKFISGVVPTINYDFTFDLEMNQ